MHDSLRVEMNFCRRCGTKVTHAHDHVFTCKNGHELYVNETIAGGMAILNDKNELLMIRRGIDPGKGTLSLPGGSCDGLERVEDAARREILEEVGLKPSDYSPLEYLTSAVEPYAYQGEELPVLGVIFVATLRSGAKPKAGNETAGVEFIPLQQVKLEDIRFPAIRYAVAALQKKY